MSFQPPRGTRDFMPGEMAVRRRAFGKIMEVFRRYGYGEVCTPAFEDFGLLARKSGPEIEEEIYAFRDKSGRLLGLRFDPTVPVCRIVSSDPSLPRPMKFCYITNMWRYDRPAAGRWREFWQAGVELVGPPGPEADAELLAVVSDCLKALGVKGFHFRISSRKVVDLFVRDAGISGKKTASVFRAVDKLDKMGEKAVVAEMESSGIAPAQARKFMKLVKAGEAAGPEMEELKSIKRLARKMGSGRIETDLSIVRGIDYYTGFVFETFVKGFERLGSVASGGRYDTLIGIYSGRGMPATGFGIGIDRLMEVLKPEEQAPPVPVFVACAKDDVRESALVLAQRMRNAGIGADSDLMGRDLRRQLEYANKKKIPYAVIIGPKEVKSGKYTLRDMRTGKESCLGLAGIIRKIRKLK